MLVPAYRQPVEAGIRDLEQQRLLVALRARAQHLDHRVVRVLVHLVNQRAIRPDAGLALLFRADRLEERGLRQVRQLPHRVDARCHQPPLEPGRAFPHRHRVSKQDRRLVLVRRGAVHLGPDLARRREHVMPDPRRHRRLAVALADLDKGAAEPPQAVRFLPPEQAADVEALPRLKRKRHRKAFDLAVVVPQLLLDRQHVGEEPDGAVRRRQVPHQVFALQVREVPRTCRPHIRPGNDLPARDRDRVGSRRVVRRSISFRSLRSCRHRRQA